MTSNREQFDGTILTRQFLATVWDARRCRVNQISSNKISIPSQLGEKILHEITKIEQAQYILNNDTTQKQIYFLRA